MSRGVGCKKLSAVATVARHVESLPRLTMQRDAALAKITDLRPMLVDLGVRSLFVFGSVARGEAAEASDIDLLSTSTVRWGSSTSFAFATSSAASSGRRWTW